MFDNLQGIDLHYHASPDAYLRKYHAIEAGKHYQQMGFGVLLRSHLGSTIEIAALCRAMGLPVLGSINLNKIYGGINYKTVLRALASCPAGTPYRLLVDLPTFRISRHQSVLVRHLSNPVYASVVQAKESLMINGKLKQSLIDLIRFACDYPILLSTGHASKAEVYLILEEAEKTGLQQLLLNQPANPATDLSFMELVEIAQRWHFVYFEQTALTKVLSYQSEEDFINVIKYLPRLIYSSDLGQKDQLSIEQWFKETHHWFDKGSVSHERRREICLVNPLNLLKI